MSAIIILTTSDSVLESAWARQVQGFTPGFSDHDLQRAELSKAGARVWIRDVSFDISGWSVHPDTVAIVVGTPHSIPFEDAKINRHDEMFLSIEESRVELRRMIPWARELAEKRAALSVNRSRRRPVDNIAGSPLDFSRRNHGELAFVETAIEHLGDFSQLLLTFERGIRSRLRCSRVVIYLRKGSTFVGLSEPIGTPVPAADPFIYWLQDHAGIVDATTLETIDDAAVEALLRQRMAGWNARILLPIHSEGKLAGWAALAPKLDGKSYSEDDREVAMDLISLFSTILKKNQAFISSQAVEKDWQLISAQGLRYRRLDATGTSDGVVPVEVQEVVGQCRKERRRVDREFGRLRVSAAPIGDSAEIWVLWDEQGGTSDVLALKLETERYQILHDLGIIISHELANALFSVSTYFQHIRKNPMHSPPMLPLLARVDEDMDRLKEMPHILGTLYEMSQRDTTEVPLRTLIEQVTAEIGGRAEVENCAPVIWGHEENLRAALIWFCREIMTRDIDSANGMAPARQIKIKLQQRQQAEGEPLCLISISYPGLRLEQIRIGAPGSVDEYPTVPVFLAREIIRFHRGTVSIGQGLGGPELNISVQSRRCQMPASGQRAAPAAGLHAADLISRQNLRSVTFPSTISAGRPQYGQPAVG